MTEKEFDGQREGEEVELVFRRHILTAWRGLFVLVVMCVIGFVPMLFWRARIDNGACATTTSECSQAPISLEKGLVGALALAWGGNRELVYLWWGFLVAGLLYAVNVYMKWYFSYFLVTNQRLRKVKQMGLFRREVVDLGLDRILTIQYKVGVMGGILGYGTLILRTQAGKMVIKMVRKPQKIYNRLQDLVNEAGVMKIVSGEGR